MCTDTYTYVYMYIPVVGSLADPLVDIVVVVTSLDNTIISVVVIM